MDDIFEHFGDIFGSVFTNGGQQRQRTKRTGPEPKNGHDLSQEITISLQEAYLGTKHEVSYYHFVSCEACKAKGVKTGHSPQQCSTCKGAGQIQFSQGFFVYAQTCATCGGEGFLISNPCPSCKGKSRIQQLEKFSVTVPAGIFDGAELRIPGKGDAGVYGGRSGDLFIKIHVVPNKKFQREGNDLVSRLTLTYPQLALGCQIEIECIDGTKETIKIPKGCAVHEKITISRKGFDDIRHKGSRGNWIVITECHIPKKISAEAKDLLTKYAAIIGNDTEESSGGITGFFKKFLG